MAIESMKNIASSNRNLKKCVEKNSQYTYVDSEVDSNGHRYYYTQDLYIAILPHNLERIMSQTCQHSNKLDNRYREKVEESNRKQHFRNGTLQHFDMEESATPTIKSDHAAGALWLE